MSENTVSQQLAKFTLHLDLAKVPETVQSHARLLFLDALGVGLAASKEQYSRIAAEVASSCGESREATALGRTLKMPAVWAALVNGIQIHGHDFDDTHSGSIAHTTSVIVPTVLSLGERQGLTGKEILTAAIGGLEATCRVGLASCGGFHTRGYHTTAIAGAMGGSLAASRCLELDVQRTVFSQGIAGSSASGLREAYLSGGSWTKLYHPGWAAHAAIMAGLMAEKGFTGTSTVYEGRFGLFKSHLHPGDGDYDALLNGLGESWELMNISFKPYPCGVINHAFIDLAIQLLDQHEFQSDEIDSIIAFIHPDAAQTVCEPVETKRRPVSGYHAKFSLHFNVAAALAEGKVDLTTYTDEKVLDTSILKLAEKIEHQCDNDSQYPKTYPAKMEIRLKDGRTFRGEIEHHKGSLKNPMKPEEVRQKFMANSKHVIGLGPSKLISEGICQLEEHEDIEEIMGMLRKRIQ